MYIWQAVTDALVCSAASSSRFLSGTVPTIYSPESVGSYSRDMALCSLATDWAFCMSSFAGFLVYR